MADLMNGTYTYKGLANKYNGFLVPALKIKVKGKDIIANMHLAVENVSITLSLNSASSCNFSVTNAYNEESRDFNSDIANALKLGTVMEIEVGYGSATTKIFKGYVGELSQEFTDFPVLTVTLFDVRRLMMDSGKRMMIHQVKNYTEAFTSVMQTYQKICTNSEVDKTTDKLDTAGVYQSLNDYDFITQDLALKTDREFFVLAGKAYFRERRKSKKPIMTLEWGNGLISFVKTASYIHAQVIVKGYDEANNEVFKGEAKVVSTDDLVKVISSPQPDIILDPDATDQEKAQTRADYEAQQKLINSQTAKASCIGLPEIVPGRFIEFDKVGEASQRKYYITKVKHAFNEGGFSTNFTVGGWE